MAVARPGRDGCRTPSSGRKMEADTHGRRGAEPLHSRAKEVFELRRSVLVAQASPRGPAGRAGELIAEVLAAHGLAVDVMPAAHVDLLDPYGAIVVGGPTRLGRWHRDACRFLQRHRTMLGRLPGTR